MITIEELELKTNFPQRYRELALKYYNEKDAHWAKPKREDMLAIFNKLDYPVKYVSIDRLYIEKHQAGKYSFEYYYEFNGMTPMIYLYIKTESDWPLERYSPGFIVAKKLYTQGGGKEYQGLFIFANTLKNLEDIFAILKPMLDDLRKAIIPYLEKDQLDFIINEEDY